AGPGGMNANRIALPLLGAAFGLAASLMPAHADCVSACDARTYCDSDMHASGECARLLNDCYIQECNRTIYGAIAYGAESGAYGWSNARPDASSAETEALGNCRKNGNDCQVVVDFWNTCAAVAAGTGHVAYGLGETRDRAESEAVATCGKDGGESCAVQAWA